MYIFQKIDEIFEIARKKSTFEKSIFLYKSDLRPPDSRVAKNLIFEPF